MPRNTFARIQQEKSIMCNDCDNAKRGEKWIHYRADCRGCMSRLAAASFKSLIPKDADKQRRTKFALQLAGFAGCTLDEMKAWM